MLGSECHLKMYVRNLGYPLPLQIWAPKTFFRRLHNLTATLTAQIFRKKMTYIIEQVRRQPEGVFYII